MTGPNLPDEDEWDPEAPDAGPAPRHVALPVRQRDRRIIGRPLGEVVPVRAELVIAGVTGRYGGLKLRKIAQPVSCNP